jgi:hypothetical protein
MTTNYIAAVKRGPRFETSFDLCGRFIAGGTNESESFREGLSERACFLYVNSAAVHGHDVDHWLLAERQIKAGHE